MGGRIEIYLDIASLYSYVAFKQLLDTAPLLKAHSVDVDIKPVLLGGINAGSGNKPPWFIPAKAKYSQFDVNRTKKAVALQEISPPEDLMAVAHTVLPLRALHYVKVNYPLATYLTTWHYLFHAFWAIHQNVSAAADLAAGLTAIPSSFNGTGTEKSYAPLFSQKEVETIMSSVQDTKFKDLLKDTVTEALDRGAFGAPWIWVMNEAGVSEPFFGSDRWHFVYEFLGLPHQRVTLLPPGGSSKL